ncbi:MAG: YncE family protein [Methylocella sp.]
MQNYNRSCASFTRGFAALGAVLAMGLASTARPAAAPFAYVVSNAQVRPGTCAAIVSVIDTGANPPAVVAMVPVGDCAIGVAITPDGKHAYVANNGSGTVSVIDTASNTEVATVPVLATVTVGPMGPLVLNPQSVGFIPPPPGVPFPPFNAQLAIHFGGATNEDAFALNNNFTLSSTAPLIHPLTDRVMLNVGTFATTIPPASFVKQKDGSFAFKGVVGAG